MTDISQLRTVKRFAEELAPTGGFSVPSLRWLVFNAAQNGLDKAKAIVRVGRRLYIDPARFSAWVDAQRKQSAV